MIIYSIHRFLISLLLLIMVHCFDDDLRWRNTSEVIVVKDRILTDVAIIFHSTSKIRHALERPGSEFYSFKEQLLNSF